LVSIQLPLEPARQPVTVTVLALELGRDCSDVVVVLEPLVPVVPEVPLVPCVPLVDPLCAATLTAKASARPEAVVTTRFMWSILQNCDVERGKYCVPRVAP
jgi:hypothetical protein